MSVTIVRGVPGSGKSTWVAEKFEKFGNLARPVWAFYKSPESIEGVRPVDLGAIFSTDDAYLSEARVYEFDFRRLGEAHGTCLRKFTEYVQNTSNAVPVVVDNTSTSVSEVAPYAAIALAYGHTLSIITLLCDPAVAAARNTHGVPEKSVLAMDKRLREEGKLLPPYWPHEVLGQ